MEALMLRKIATVLLILIFTQTSNLYAGSTDSEELSNSNDTRSAKDCFEGLSRVMFKFNHTLDSAILEPVAKGYRAIPSPIRKGTGNALDNLRSLLTFSNNILQGNFRAAGNTAGRFAINTTVGILGIFDPAAKLGLKEKDKEDFGQTMGVWGTNTGCYFVLPILGPTTTRDAIGLVGNVFLDPVYQITHNTEMDNGIIGNGSYSEHNYYYYKGSGAVDFRSKNIESFNSIEQNSIDLYASVKSLYLQDREAKILNSRSDAKATHDDSVWEEIDTK